MLGHSIDDPHGMEGPPGHCAALGWLPLQTRLEEQKQLRNEQGISLLTDQPCAVSGYEIHLGVTDVAVNARPLWHRSDGSPDGCISEDGQVAGGYLHGLFDSPAMLNQLMAVDVQSQQEIDYRQQQQAAIDRLADCVVQHLDMNKIKDILGLSEMTDVESTR